MLPHSYVYFLPFQSAVCSLIRLCSVAIPSICLGASFVAENNSERTTGRIPSVETVQQSVAVFECSPRYHCRRWLQDQRQARGYKGSTIIVFFACLVAPLALYFVGWLVDWLIYRLIDWLMAADQRVVPSEKINKYTITRTERKYKKSQLCFYKSIDCIIVTTCIMEVHNK